LGRYARAACTELGTQLCAAHRIPRAPLAHRPVLWLRTICFTDDIGHIGAVLACSVHGAGHATVCCSPATSGSTGSQGGLAATHNYFLRRILGILGRYARAACTELGTQLRAAHWIPRAPLAHRPVLWLRTICFTDDIGHIGAVLACSVHGAGHATACCSPAISGSTGSQGGLAVTHNLFYR
jgi:hypothetical protein